MSTINTKLENEAQIGKSEDPASVRARKRLAHLLEHLPSLSQSQYSPLPPSFTSGEIQQRSVLHNPAVLQQIARSDWVPMLDASLFAHVTSDSFIQGTDLEGNHMENTSLFLSRFLSFIQDKKSLFDPETMQNFQTLLSQLQTPVGALDFAKRIIALTPGQSALMQGGWSGTQKTMGHAMVYEFCRREDGNYDVIIYNTGAGAESYHSTASDGRKIKIQRMIKYEGVLPEELGLSSSSNGQHHLDLFEDLIRCHTHKHYKDKETTPKQIYEGTFGHLRKKIAPAAKGAAFFATPQRSGTCTEYVLKPIAYRYLCKEDLKTFKRHHFYKRFYSIVGFFQKELSQLPLDDQNGKDLRHLLTNSSLKLLRSTAKLLTKGHISQEEALEVQATLSEITGEIEVMDKQIDAANLAKTKEVSLTAHDGEKLSRELLSSPITSTAATTPNLQSIPPTPPLIPTGKDFLAHLERLLATAVSMKKPDLFAAITEIDQCFQTLPSPSRGLVALCEQVPPPHLAKSLETLSELINLYTHLCLTHTSFLSSQQNTALSMLAYQHRLSVQQDEQIFGRKARCKEFSIDLRCYEKSLEDPYLVFYHPKDFERRIELLQYFKHPQNGVKQEHSLCNFPDTLNKSYTSENHEGDYLLSLINNVPELEKVFEKEEEEIRRRDPGLKAFPIQTVQKAIILNRLFKQHYLASPKVGHVFKLRNSAFMANLFVVNNKPTVREKDNNYAPHISNDNGKLTIFRRLNGGHSVLLDPRELLTASSMHYTENPRKMSDLLRTFPFKRIPDLDTLPLESHILDKWRTQKRSFPCEEAVAATNCKPSLQPAKVLYHYMSHLSELDSFEKQGSVETLFNTLFFRPSLPTASVPLFDELPANQALQRQSIDFIHQGIDYFYRKQPGQRPKIGPCLFFVRLANRLHAIDPSFNLPTLGLMNEWLQNKALTASERSHIHLHRLLYYRSLPFEKLASEEIGDMLGSWILYNQCPIDPPYHNPHLHEEGRQSIYSCSLDLQKKMTQHPEGNSAICNRILASCNLQPIEGANWVGTYPLYKQENGKAWHLNLLTGKIASELGLVSSGVSSIFGSDYRRLFGEIRFEMKKMGNEFSFEHPAYGPIRIFKGEESREYYFFRQIEGAWFQYIRPDDLKHAAPEYLPSPLVNDHSHWLSVGKPRTMKVYPLERPSQPAATVVTDRIQVHQNEEPLLPITLDKLSPLAQFERAEMYVVTSDPARKALQTIRAPRYRSLSGRELQFVRKDKNLYWEENPAFFLSTQPANPPIPNSLLLTDRAGAAKKLLVPMLPIVSTMSVEPSIELNVKKNDKLNTTLLEYDLQGDRLIPQHLEGTCYYAFILLAEKKYGPALQMIQSIPKGAPLSNTSLMVLKWIAELTSSHGTSTATSAAIRLRAIEQFNLRQMDANIIPMTEGEKKKWVEFEKQTRAVYTAGENNVPFDLRLPNQTADTPPISKPVEMQDKQSLVLDASLDRLPWDLDDYTIKYRLVDLVQNINASPSEYMPTIANQFGRLYELARKSKTDAEKIQLTTLLRYVDSRNLEGAFLLRLIHFAYFHPENAPAYDPQNQQQWFVSIMQLYTTVFQAQQRYRSAPTRPTLSTPKTPPKKSLDPFPISLPMTRPKANIQSANLTIAQIDEKRIHPQSLGALTTQHFQAVQSVSGSERLQFNNLAKSSEDPFFDASLAEIKEFQQDYDTGADKSQKRVLYQLKTAQELTPIKRSLETKITSQEERLKAIETLIAAIKNKQSIHLDERLHDQLLEQGQALLPVQMQELITIFYREDLEGYKSVNRHLTARDIEALNQAIFDYLLTETELAQAKRAKGLVEALSDPGAKNKEALSNQLAETLNAKVAYTPHIEKIMLVFEHRAGIRLRAPQVDLIRRMLQIDPKTSEYRNLVAQLMMGGGKTTVISSLLLERAARPGRIPILIAPDAQFETLRMNVSFAQAKHFLRDVIPIDMMNKPMNVEMLTWIKNALETASSKGSIVLIKAETLQSLQLEFLSQLKQRKETEKAGVEPSKDSNQRILLLQASLKIFAQNGDALIDEVDVILAPQRVVNRPVGDLEPIPARYVDFMRNIALLHASDTLMVDSKSSVNSLLQLRKARPSGIDIPWYKEKIRPVIVRELFSMMHKKWMIDPAFAHPFERYILGDMKPRQLTKQDREFLNCFKKLGISKIEQEKEIADEIALCKEYFQQILPSVLAAEVNQNFGRTRGSPPGKVVPFLGVDSPAPTEFGNPLEASFYHFLTALRLGVDEGQIKKLAYHMNESAEHHVLKDDIPYIETAEAKEFFALTSIPLHLINEPGNLQKAMAYINQDLQRIMMIEAETICSTVGSYPLFFSSNAQNLEAQISTKRALSGTPFNYPSYSQSLKENLALDVGVEGEIAHTLFKRNCPIHSYKKADIREILDTAIRGGTSRARLRGFIDVSGVLTEKGSNNESIAGQILEFYKDDPSIDTVLFFGRKTASESTPDHLMALRKQNIGKPELIGTTDAKVLRTKGIDPEKTFIYYDERHREATDLPQKPDAINLLSVSEKTRRRDFFQGTLRPRQFFEGQTIECVISEEARKKLPNGGKTILDVLSSLCANQAVFKAKENFRSYQHKIDHIPRQAGIDALIQSPQDIEILQKTYNEHEQALVTDQTIRPFEQLGGLDELLATGTVLAQKAKQPDPKPMGRFSRILKQMEPKKTPYDALLKEATKDPYLPTKVPNRTSSLGQTVEVKRQIQVTVQQEIELERELEQELLRYNAIGDKSIYKERPWANMEVTKVGTRSESAQIHTLQDLLSSKAGPKYEKPYSKIFDANLFVSSNFAFTYNSLIPVFLKAQKPAHQILVIEKKSALEFVILSIDDADHFKKQLQKDRPGNMWLILPDAKEISSHPHKALDAKQQQALSRALIQINLFNANARYLSIHEQEVQQFMQEKDLELKRRFLTLQVEKNKTQRAIFYRNEILSGRKQAKTGVIQHIARRNATLAKKQTLPPLTLAAKL